MEISPILLVHLTCFACVFVCVCVCVCVCVRERERERGGGGDEGERAQRTIIENGNDKHHKRWKVKLPYESQQHETKLSPYQTNKGKETSQISSQDTLYYAHTQTELLLTTIRIVMETA
jgi:hypothetical protein